MLCVTMAILFTAMLNSSCTLLETISIVKKEIEKIRGEPNKSRLAVVGCRVSGRLPHEGPGSMCGMLSMGVFLEDPSPD